MFKKLGDILYKTPWWALLLMGLLTLLLLGLFATPFNVIRLSDQGTTNEERRAIKREIDSAFMSGALNIAENVVGEMKARSSDAARRAELDDALREIRGAKQELDRELQSAASDAALSAKDYAEVARSATREAAKAAMGAASAAATSAREAADEKLTTLREALEEARAAQRKAGIDDAKALESYERAIARATEARTAADEALKRIERELNASKSSLSLGLGKIPPKAPAAPPATAAPPASPAPAAPPAPPAKPADPIDDFTFDLSIGDRKVTRETVVDADGKKSQIVRIDGELLPPLAPEVRQEIRTKVARDVRRVGIGSALILLFIPLFLILVIAKVFAGRARRAVAFAEVKKKEAESANVNRQIVEAKLQALQAQVEPHFLYNTLANVQALTEIDPVKANQMTGHLINYLRAALPKMRESSSTIGQELELVRAYLNILKMRMGDRLAFDIDVAPALLTLPFPPLMLPSLVENAIKHGLEPKREGGRIDVRVTREGNELSVTVNDTGRGLTGAPVQAGGGVGLSNIRERLHALFGDAAKLQLESNEPSGVVASIRVPADGVGFFTQAQPAPAPPPTGFWPRFKSAFGRTHSAWSRAMAWVLVALLVALLITFVGALIGMVSGRLPLAIGHTELGGLEGMAIGTALLAVAFAALSLVAVILVALLYGLGYFFLGLLIVIPIIILVSVFPAIAPFVFVGGAVYWWMRRKKSKDAEGHSTKP